MTTPSGPRPGQPDPGLAPIISDFKNAWQAPGDHVTRIWAIRNPDKLRPWATG
jgi:hypothetical protein